MTQRPAPPGQFTTRIPAADLERLRSEADARVVSVAYLTTIAVRRLLDSLPPLDLTPAYGTARPAEVGPFDGEVL